MAKSNSKVHKHNSGKNAKHNSDKKAQVAMEYLVLVGFMLFIISIATAYALFTYYENVKISSVRTTVYDLQKASNQVYALGPGNSIFVEFSLPDGVSEDSLAINDFLFYRVQLFSGESDFIVDLKGNITEFDLPTYHGPHTIKVTVVDENIVFTEI